MSVTPLSQAGKDRTAAVLIREREPFLKRDGQGADNEQLSGEPSLTEAERPSRDAIAQTGAKVGCDLDCIEAELAEEEQREQRRKGTLEVGRETGAIGTEEETDAGDALAAEPSTTTVAEAAPEATARQLPTRLGPARIPVGKAEDWMGIGLAVPMELAIRYNIVYLTPWLRSDARTYGQAQIMNAADPTQANTHYGRNGDQRANQDLTIAGSARMIGNSLKVTTETAWVMQLWNTGRLNGIEVNAQIQLVF